MKEFAVKLSKVKESLFTETAHAIARQRHTFMVEFFQRMAAEVAGAK
jgi:uncharacterized protein